MIARPSEARTSDPRFAVRRSTDVANTAAFVYVRVTVYQYPQYLRCIALIYGLLSILSNISYFLLF